MSLPHTVTRPHGPQPNTRSLTSAPSCPHTPVYCAHTCPNRVLGRPQRPGLWQVLPASALPCFWPGSRVSRACHAAAAPGGLWRRRACNGGARAFSPRCLVRARLPPWRPLGGRCAPHGGHSRTRSLRFPRLALHHGPHRLWWLLPWRAGASFSSRATRPSEDLRLCVRLPSLQRRACQEPGLQGRACGPRGTWPSPAGSPEPEASSGNGSAAGAVRGLRGRPGGGTPHCGDS